VIRSVTTITIVPDDPQASPPRFCALAGQVQAVGATVGQALDALTAQLDGPAETTLVVVQPMRPDSLFTAAQQQLEQLMPRWRAARDAGTLFPPEAQAELDALVQAELRAAAERSATLARRLES
jgi:hypothetical protein